MNGLVTRKINFQETRTNFWVFKKQNNWTRKPNFDRVKNYKY